MKTKLLTIKTTTKLDEKEQAKRQRIIALLATQGMPEDIVDSYIYRIGLYAADLQKEKDR